MKVCYIDETGSEENSPFYVMAGICFDFSKHYKCSRNANLMIANMKKKFFEKNKKHCKEIKTKRFINGSDKWSNIPHEERDDFITKMLNIFKTSFTNSFDIYISVIDNSKYKTLSSSIKDDITGAWVTNALHIVLQRQADIYGTQKNKNNKALTFMIYDNHVDISKLNDLLYMPKKYFYEYFSIKSPKKSKKISIDAVIGEGFCINSQHSGLCQLADICSFVIRRYIELQSGSKEEYDGEKVKFINWYDLIKEKIYIYSKLFRQKSENSILSFYHSIMPDNLDKILKRKHNEK